MKDLEIVAHVQCPKWQKKVAPHGCAAGCDFYGGIKRVGLVEYVRCAFACTEPPSPIGATVAGWPTEEERGSPSREAKK